MDAETQKAFADLANRIDAIGEIVTKIYDEVTVMDLNHCDADRVCDTVENVLRNNDGHK